MEEFLDFYVNGYTRLLRSIVVLLFPLSEVAALVVDPGSGLFSTGFAGENAPRAVFRTMALRRMEKCTQKMLRPTFFLGNLDILSSEPVVLQYFQLCAVSASDFLGALDDEEFFVVEGSGVAGSPGV